MLGTRLHDLVDSLLKRLVELAHHVLPLLFSLSDLIELVLDLRREVVVHDLGEVLQEEVVDHNANVGGDELSFLRTGELCLCCRLHLVAFQDVNSEFGLFASPVAFLHIVALLDRRNRRRVGRRASDTKFLQFVYETGLGISCRSLGETFHRGNAFAGELLTHLQCGQGSELLRLLVIVGRFLIDFQETVEDNDLTAGDELLGLPADIDVNRGFLDLCLSHLGGNGALPDQVVETFFLCRTVDSGVFHMGRSNSLMGFLCPFGLCMEVTGRAILLTKEFGDRLLTAVDGKCREVDAVGTHIGDASVFIELLCNAHGLRHGEPQLSGSFLLQGRSRERRRRRALQRFFRHIAHGEDSVLATVEEVESLIVCGKALIELCLDLHTKVITIYGCEDGSNTVVRLTLEGLYLTFTLYDESDGHALYTSCRQRRFDFSPQYR